MELAKKSKRNKLLQAIFALVCAVVGAPLLAVSILFGLYPLMAVLIVLVGYGCYGIVFWFWLYSRAAARVRCVRAVEEKGLLSYSDISKEVGLNERATFLTLSKCVGKRFLTRYGIGKDSLVRV